MMDRLPKNITYFAIGDIKATDDANPLVWFRLYPRKISPQQSWWYFKYDNLQLSVHSKPRVSSTSAGLVVLDPACWSKMNAIISLSNYAQVIKTEKFNKDMFGKPFEKVKSIGSLTLID
jgi:hypothetical protein